MARRRNRIFAVAHSKQAAIGLRAHSGWTALVAVCVEKGSPVVLARQRLHLVETFTYEFRQPYHTAEKMPQGQGREFISRMQAEAKTGAETHALRPAPCLWQSASRTGQDSCFPCADTHGGR